MKVVNEISKFPDCAPSLALTIGNFDGLHLGHFEIINALKSHGCPTAALTFSNHPSKLFSPSAPVSLLCHPEHKLKLLEVAGIDYTLFLPFTLKFSRQTPKTFIEHLRSYVPFRHLVLGDDAAFGKGREGTPESIRKLAKQYNFSVHYLQKRSKGELEISSSLIRERIKAGNFEAAGQLFGREYSIAGRVISGKQLGRKLGYPTANIDISDLCLPPYGVYSAFVKTGNTTAAAVINLGFAPTTRSECHPLLEVHLLDCEDDLYGKYVEVFPKSFLREEMKFPNLQALQSQITDDIVKARKTL